MRLIHPEILGIAAPLVEVPFVEVTGDGLRMREASSAGRTRMRR